MPIRTLLQSSLALALIPVVALWSSAAFAQHGAGGLVTPPEIRQSLPQAPAFRDFLPEAVDISQYMPPVGDQGQQASCVGWAAAYAARAYYAEQVEHRDISTPDNQPSPAWVYDIIHQGDANCNGGSRIPDAMKVLMQGDYSLADFPYSETACVRPAIADRAKPSDFKIDGFEQVYESQGDRSLDKVKGALAKGEPVVSLIILDQAFEVMGPNTSIWQSTPNMPSYGGHAITLVGYDDRSKLFRFINSWGTQWGKDGYGAMTYDTFQARTAEAYVMTLPGDPDISLSSADINPTPVVLPAPAPPFIPPLNVRPTSTRDFGATAEAPVDVGPLSCGRVDITTDVRGNSIARGFVGSASELERVTAALDGKVDENDVTLTPWPACELKLTLAAPLADTDRPQVVVDPAAPKVSDDVRIGIEAPGFASYIYASYLSADGSVANLLQPGADALKAKPPHNQVVFGDAETGGPTLTVTAPVGDESMIVIASEKPLFDKSLPPQTDARAYLSALREAMLSGDAGRVTATVVGVTTSQ
jgi:hypothetical protein